MLTYEDPPSSTLRFADVTRTDKTPAISIPLTSLPNAAPDTRTPEPGDLVQLTRRGKAIESYATVTKLLSSECLPGRFLVMTSEGKVRAVTLGPHAQTHRGTTWVAP